MRLLITICVLTFGCPNSNLPKEKRDYIREDSAIHVITGDASTRTPSSPAITGGENMIIYDGRKPVKRDSPSYETLEAASDDISASIADLRKHVLHNAEGDRLIMDCVRQTPEEWIAQHCEARKKDWLRKQRELEMEDKKP